MIAEVTPVAFAQVDWRYYLVFAICGFTNALTIWMFFPETKGMYTFTRFHSRNLLIRPRLGRTLEEMDEYFSFEKMPLFVPAAKVEKIDQFARERELARGDNVRDVDSTQKEDFAGEKAHIEHNA